ncbi:hypothetical protein AFLA_003189 [Aspergillus flavus NRRL3357]|nr:hypothetical protein AFLA_003189 [Aspergillus flavus NRRL3357]
MQSAHARLKRGSQSPVEFMSVIGVRAKVRNAWRPLVLKTSRPRSHSSSDVKYRPARGYGAALDAKVI